MKEKAATGRQVASCLHGARRCVEQAVQKLLDTASLSGRRGQVQARLDTAHAAVYRWVDKRCRRRAHLQVAGTNARGERERTRGVVVATGKHVVVTR